MESEVACQRAKSHLPPPLSPLNDLAYTSSCYDSDERPPRTTDDTLHLREMFDEERRHFGTR